MKIKLEHNTALPGIEVKMSAALVKTFSVLSFPVCPLNFHHPTQVLYITQQPVCLTPSTKASWSLMWKLASAKQTLGASLKLQHCVKKMFRAWLVIPPEVAFCGPLIVQHDKLAVKSLVLFKAELDCEGEIGACQYKTGYSFHR